MAASSLLRLGQVQAGTSLTTLYTAPDYPSNVRVGVQTIWMCNTDTAAHTIAVRVGTGTLTVANSLVEAPIAASTTYVVGDQQGFAFMLHAGEKIQVLADVASKVTVTVYGMIFNE